MEDLEFFRREVTRRRHESLVGPLVIKSRVGWLSIFAIAICVVTPSLAIVGLATSSDAIIARGTISAGDQVVQIVAPRNGSIFALLASDGQLVRAGQPIIRVATEDLGRDGEFNSDFEKKVLDEEASTLRTKILNLKENHESDNRKLRIQEDELKSRISYNKTRLPGMRALIVRMEESFERASKYAERGFVTRNDLLRQEQAIIERRDALALIEREINADESELLRLAEDGKKLVVNYDLAMAEQRESAMRTQQAAVALSARRGYELRSTISGIVRNFDVRVGDRINAGTIIASVSDPKIQNWRCRLQLDDRAAALIQPGDLIKITLTAFPSSQYGFLRGSVLRVQQSPSSVKSGVPVYVAVGSIEITDEIRRQYPSKLIDGMTAQATISLRDISLIDRIRNPRLWFSKI